MNQRDDAAVKVSHDSSESNERHSVTRAVSSVREIDKLSPEEQRSAGADCGDRPTLMGLAPVELPGQADPASGSHSSHGTRTSEPETSTVQPAHWLASEAAQDAPENAAATALETQPELADAREGIAASKGADSEEDEDAPAKDEAGPAQEEPGAVHAQPEVPAGMQVSTLMPGPEHARLLQARQEQEGESEWLDLSTRWLVTSGPRVAQPTDDENEVTDAYWAERLAARVAPRPETPSSAPPPPPNPGPHTPGTRRATLAYELPVGPEAQAFDAASQQRPWEPRRQRHSTLAGISPLPEDPNEWPPPAASTGRPRSEPNPWREEPSYSDAPAPQRRGRNTLAGNYPLPGGSIPPWAAPMSPYAMQPQAAMMSAYAPNAWNGGVTLPPPWAAQPNYGMPPQPPAYAPSDRRATRTMDYALPPNTGATSTNARAQRAPQANAAEISFEQWKGMANTWFMTVGKLALAAMALHFSGLAKPLLANFGYAPASASAGAAEPVAHAPVPAAASLAAGGVIPEGLSPESADEPAPRRAAAKREPSESSEPSEGPARRHSSSSKAHRSKPKSAHAKAARSAAAETPAAPAVAPAVPAAPVVAAPQADRAPAQPVAAEPASAEPAGEAILRINSRPWSEIFVDGTHVGHTPKLDLRVSAGSHRIRLVNQELGLSKTFEVDLDAGETVSHVELFVD